MSSCFARRLQAARRRRGRHARRARAAAASRDAARPGPAVAPARPLAPRDQAAIIALASRAPRLTLQRLDELAVAGGGGLGRCRPFGPDGHAPRARRRPVAALVRPATMMTPLQFEQLYEGEWSSSSADPQPSRRRRVGEGAPRPPTSRAPCGVALPACLRAPCAGARPRLSRLHRRSSRTPHSGCPSADLSPARAGAAKLKRT